MRTSSTTIGLALMLLLWVKVVYSQCAAPNVTVTDYCNNQYAEFNINDPDPNVRYQWFSDAAGSNSIGYGPNADGKYFHSPTTYSSGSGPQNFWVQKQTTGVTGGPTSAGFTGATSGNQAGRTGTVLIDATVDFTLHSITIPIHAWSNPAPGVSYGIKISIGGTASDWYYFTSANLVAGPNNILFLKVPVDVGGLGLGLPVTAGNGIQLQAFMEADGTEAAGTQFLQFAVLSSGVNANYSIGNGGCGLDINKAAGDQTTWPAGRFGFFDWDVTLKQPLVQVTANEETDASVCCVPVTDQPVIQSSTGSYTIEAPVTASLTATNANASHYFKWFKDGALFQEGAGLTQINITDFGEYTVYVAERAQDIDKASCYQLSAIAKIREQLVFIAPADTQKICLGDALNLTSTGGLSDWQWSTTGGGNVDNPTNANTSWTPNAEGTFKVAVEAMVPEGELVVNGDFEQGNTGFSVSTGMRYADWNARTNTNVPGCGTGDQLIFRNYGASGNGNGVYTIGTTAPLQDVWCFNGGVTDHTTGNGNFFMMDGLTQAGWQDLAMPNFIWQQNVVVTPNTNYDFSAWFASLDAGGPGPPKIQLLVDGVPVTLTDNLTYSENWDRVGGTWNSGNISGQVTLSILNAANIDGGNDFAMDDISFTSGNVLQSDTTVVVVEQCVDPCVPPTDVSITDDTLKICDQEAFNHQANVTLGNNPLNGYYYSWFKDGTEIVAPTQTATNSHSGTGTFGTSEGWYKIRVEDGNNGEATCYLEDSIYLDIYEFPTVDLGNDIVACKGPFTLDAGNSVANQTYVWTPGGATTQTIDVNENGVNTYKVVVSNWNCKDSDEVQVTIDTVLAVNIGPDTTICENAFPISLDGGAGYTSYEWRDAANAVLGVTQNLSVSAVGEYNVFVEDASGCKGRDTIEVFTKPLPDPTINNGVDTITICPTSPNVTLTTAQGAPATYLWSPGGETQQSISTNVQNWYSVVVTLDGCTAEDSIYLQVANELQVNIGDDLTLCPGVEAQFYTSFAGFTHDWNNGASALDTFKTTTAGMVTVHVTDPGGCEGRDTAYLTVENPLQISIGPDQTICENEDSVTFAMVSGRTDVTVVGWNNGSTGFNLKSKTAGIHWLEVDSAGCTYRDSAELFINSLPVVDLGPDTFICKGTGETIPLDAGAGFAAYLWSKKGNGSSQTLVASDSGEYKVTVTDNNNCLNSDSLFIDEKDATLFELFGGKEDTTICPLGSATVNLPSEVASSPSTNWTWLMDNTTSNGNSVTVDNRSHGDQVGISLNFVNEFGCISKDTFTVLVNNTLPITLRDTAICVGQDITFNSGYPVAGYTYVWNNDAAQTNSSFAISNATINNTGLIEVAVVSDEGCSGQASANLTVNALPQPVLNDITVCAGETATFDPGVVGASYVWQPNGETGATLDATLAGLYKVVVTDGNGCIDSSEANLFVNPLPVFTITQMPDEACVGETIQLTTGLGAGYSHNWTPGGETTGSIDVTTDNTYSVEVTNDATNCRNTSSKDVVFKPIPVAIITPGVDTAHICEDEKQLLLSNATPYTVSWQELETGTPFTDKDLSVTKEATYVLKVDNDGCFATDTIFVDVHELPDAPLGNDTTVCMLDVGQVVIDAGRAENNYVWNTGDTTSAITVTTQGSYSIDITSPWGCKMSDEVYVDDDCPWGVYLPNAFTPNDDGLNDFFEIKGHNLISVEVMVFNRWGEHIWTGTQLGAKWDGKYMGNLVQIDVYVWKMNYSYEDYDETIQHKEQVGTVTVVR